MPREPSPRQRWLLAFLHGPVVRFPRPRLYFALGLILRVGVLERVSRSMSFNGIVSFFFVSAILSKSFAILVLILFGTVSVSR